MSANDSNSLTAYQSDVIVVVAIVLNSFSILGCLIVIVVYLYLRHINIRTVDRVSIRLAFAACVSDLLYSIAQIWSDVSKTESSGCSISVLFYVFFSLFTTIMITMVAVNLQLVFLCGWRNTDSAEKWYYGAALVLSAAPSFCGLIFKQYGWSEAQESCWFVGDGTPQSLMWQWGVLYGLVSLCILYCLATVIAVLVKVFLEQKKIQKVSVYPGPSELHNASFSHYRSNHQR